MPRSPFACPACGDDACPGCDPQDAPVRRAWYALSWRERRALDLGVDLAADAVPHYREQAPECEALEEVDDVAA